MALRIEALELEREVAAAVVVAVFAVATTVLNIVEPYSRALMTDFAFSVLQRIADGVLQAFYPGMTWRHL